MRRPIAPWKHPGNLHIPIQFNFLCYIVVVFYFVFIKCSADENEVRFMLPRYMDMNILMWFNSTVWDDLTELYGMIEQYCMDVKYFKVLPNIFLQSDRKEAKWLPPVPRKRLREDADDQTIVLTTSLALPEQHSQVFVPLIEPIHVTTSYEVPSPAVFNDDLLNRVRRFKWMHGRSFC